MFMNDALSLVVALLGVPLLTFAFGWSILERFTSLDDEERFAASWGVGFAFLGFAEFLAFLSGVPQDLFNCGAAAAMVAGVVLCRSHRRTSDPKSAEFWMLVGVSLLGYAHLLCIQMLLPQYVGGDWWYDWCMHYQAAQMFLGTRDLDFLFGGGYHLSSRTPLFNLVAAFVLSLTGERFWVFQIVASWMNWCFPAALYLVLRDRFGARIGRLALILAPMNLWMLHMAWFTWPKLLAAYFLILGLHFYLGYVRLRRDDPPAARQRFLLFWGSALLGVMTHSVGVVYLAPLLLHALWTSWRQHRLWPRPRDLLWLAATAVLIAGPWFAWLIMRFGYAKVAASSPLSVMKPDPARGMWFVISEWLAAMGENLGATLLPLPDYSALLAPNPLARLYLQATGMYFSLLTGALTLSLLAFISLLTTRERRKKMLTALPSLGAAEEPSALWLFVGLGYLGALALHPSVSIHGLTHNAGFTSAIVLVGLAWSVLGRARTRWLLGVTAAVFLEFLFMLWTHVWLTATPVLLDPSGQNEWSKEDDHLVFLRDTLGGAYPFGVAAALTVELALITSFLSWLVRRSESSFGPPDDAPGKPVDA
jgi:hypothetical protein